MSQRWWNIGNSVYDLTGPKFEPHTSRSGDERVTVRPSVYVTTYSLKQQYPDAKIVAKAIVCNQTRKYET